MDEKGTFTYTVYKTIVCALVLETTNVPGETLRVTNTLVFVVDDGV